MSEKTFRDELARYKKYEASCRSDGELSVAVAYKCVGDDMKPHLAKHEAMEKACKLAIETSIETREEPPFCYECYTKDMAKHDEGCFVGEMQSALAPPEKTRHVKTADEKRLTAITAALEEAVIEGDDGGEMCKVCGHLDEHAPDCLVTGIQYLIKSPGDFFPDDDAQPEKTE